MQEKKLKKKLKKKKNITMNSGNITAITAITAIGLSSAALAVSLNNKEGATGVSGQVGATGASGGPIGATGVTGEQGVSGVSGQQGPTGPVASLTTSQTSGSGGPITHSSPLDQTLTTYDVVNGGVYAVFFSASFQITISGGGSVASFVNLFEDVAPFNGAQRQFSTNISGQRFVMATQTTFTATQTTYAVNWNVDINGTLSISSWSLTVIRLD